MTGFTVVLNESSRTAADNRAAIEDGLQQAGIHARVLAVRGPELADAAEHGAAAGGPLIAAGGDGTVSTVASAAVRSGVTFGIIPLGTLNHFARDAGIPLELEAAIGAIAAGHTQWFDVGELNGRTFLNNVSLGFYPRIVREREMEEAKGHRKWTAFAIAITRTWIRYRTVNVRMTVDGAPLLRRTPFVFVANGEYATEGLQLGTRASLNGERLWIYVAPECTRFEMLTMSLRALAGRLGPNVKLEIFSAAEISIDTRHEHIGVAIDGELLVERPPLRSAIRPRVLQMIVPGGSSA